VNEIIKRILGAVENIVYSATSLQPDQFNPESYEVPADDIDDLTEAYSELLLMEEIPDDYII
jgi:hypothetical protein